MPTDTLTNNTKPKTSATLTIRIIKSFEYRTEKSLILHGVNLEEMTVKRLKEVALEAVQTGPGFKPYRDVALDTLKLYSKAHGAKTSNLIINLDHPEWILDNDDQFLVDLGIENETEISFFNRQLYEEFLLHPETQWEC